MDDPALDARRHDAALRGLARINRLSRADAVLFPFIRALAGPEPITLLDVATGSGDVPIALWNRARRAGIDISIRACDVSPRAIANACANARSLGAEIDFFVADAVDGDPLPPAGVVTCSLFLHHLGRDDAGRMLARLSHATERRLLVSDLRRGRLGRSLARVVPRLVTTSDVVHTDAVRSVDAAFTIEELRSLTSEAGLRGATVVARPPARMLLVWEPKA